MNHKAQPYPANIINQANSNDIKMSVALLVVTTINYIIITMIY